MIECIKKYHAAREVEVWKKREKEEEDEEEITDPSGIISPSHKVSQVSRSHPAGRADRQAARAAAGCGGLEHG